MLHGLDDRPAEACALQRLAAVHHDLDQWDAAIECLDRSLQLHTDLNDRWGQAQTLADLAHAYEHRGLRASAEIARDRSATLFLQLGATPPIKSPIPNRQKDEPA